MRAVAGIPVGLALPARRGPAAPAGMVRVWLPRDPAELAARLGHRHLAAWAEDGVLHVLWRGEAERAVLAGGIQLPLWPVNGAAGLWEMSARVRRLDGAVHPPGMGRRSRLGVMAGAAP